MVGSSACPVAFKVQIFIEQDEDSFHAYCPALVGLHTCGDTEEEALNNATDAAKAYLISLLKHNEPLPIGVTSDSETKRTLHFHRKPIISQHIRELELAGV